MNIELHIEKVQSILDQMDLQKKCKFAAWCCNALIIEKKINENMTKIKELIIRSCENTSFMLYLK